MSIGLNQSQPPQSSIGLIGAYERDNFGDLLFLERTRRYFKHFGMREETLTPFRSARELLTSREPILTSDVLRSGAPRALWTVGGEVGAVPVFAAYSMLDASVQHPGFENEGRQARRSIIRREASAGLTDLAYLPRPSAFPTMWGVPSVLNSVGLSGISSLRGDLRVSADQTLRDADYVAVRERASHSLLESMGIAHVLAPDLVHTLRLDRPEWSDAGSRRAARRAQIVLVQMSAAALGNAGTEALARALCGSEGLAGREVRLFTAGLAPSHDSTELYDDVASRVRAMNPPFSISSSVARTPLEKAEEIAGASLVIGTSLHAMILSISFDVPHVGLIIDKISRYSDCWGDPMPTAVSLGELSSAVSYALSLEPKLAQIGLADRLAASADAAISQGIEVVMTDTAEKVEQRRRRREEGARLVRRHMLAPRNFGTKAIRSAIRPLS